MQEPLPRKRRRKTGAEKPPPMMARSKAIFARRNVLTVHSPPPAFLIGLPPPLAQPSSIESEGQATMGDLSNPALASPAQRYASQLPGLAPSNGLQDSRIKRKLNKVALRILLSTAHPFFCHCRRHRGAAAELPGAAHTAVVHVRVLLQRDRPALADAQRADGLSRTCRDSQRHQADPSGARYHSSLPRQA